MGKRGLPRGGEGFGQPDGAFEKLAFAVDDGDEGDRDVEHLAGGAGEPVENFLNGSVQEVDCRRRDRRRWNRWRR